jgi:hypothetical protein
VDAIERFDFPNSGKKAIISFDWGRTQVTLADGLSPFPTLGRGRNTVHPKTLGQLLFQNFVLFLENLVVCKPSSLERLEGRKALIDGQPHDDEYSGCDQR